MKKKAKKKARDVEIKLSEDGCEQLIKIVKLSGEDASSVINVLLSLCLVRGVK